jgi:N-acetylglutamate synthase-like GNAT family acetyltransferase
MSLTEEFQLRRGTPDDRLEITALLKHEEMGEGIEPSECLVAESNQGLLGFARVEEVEGAGYLRPIIISKQGQGKGIGRFLLEALQQKWDKLFLVARGEAIGFYQKLGFENADWQEVAEMIHQECLECPKKESCRPIPMLWSAPHSLDPS